jgi:hypothetical protein
MGQYLAIGIVRSFSVKKNELAGARITREELEGMIVNEQAYDFSLLDMAESDEYFTYRLKDGVLKEDLLPLLKQIYPMLYNSPTEYESVLGKLLDMSEQEIIQYADRKSNECFQRDSYSEQDYFYANNKRIAVNYGDLIMIALEGKIVMETYGGIFVFAKKCMVRSFPDLKLASCLRMYITG